MKTTNVTDAIEDYIFQANDERHDISLPYRLESEIAGIEIKTDVHEFFRSSISYLRITPDQQRSAIRFSNDYTIERVASSTLGLIVKLRYADKPYLLWFPAAPVLTQQDQHSRLTPTGGIHYLWSMQSHLELKLSPTQQGQDIFIPLLLAASDVDELFSELTALEECERRLYVKSEWFFSNDPGEVWGYLINGSLYDPRSCPPVGKRFKCQQCAYAWWTYFDYIHNQTKKKVWALLRDEIALCALKDMEETGAWRNGFWFDNMEIHSRFQLDGLHLLISQYERTESKQWLDAAKRGMGFVREQLAETLDDGSVWYLHDDVHTSKRHQIRSTAFGKSTGNSLCLNTHIQALTVLHRLSLHVVKENNPYETMFQDGINALQRVMAHQPADPLYRYFVPRLLVMSRDASRSTLGLIKKRLKKRFLAKVYWKVRARYPRLVQPNGFIERDLTVEMASDRYHVTNVKDLLTLYLQRPLPWLHTYIENGFEFLLDYVKEVGIEAAIRRSPYFIEVAEIMYMYNKAVNPVSDQDLSDIIEGISRQTNGCSLDYYASDLVHIPES